MGFVDSGVASFSFSSWTKGAVTCAGALGSFLRFLRGTTRASSGDPKVTAVSAPIPGSSDINSIL